MNYQWRFNGTEIPGATSNSYTFAVSHPANAGSYDVVVSNSGGAVTIKMNNGGSLGIKDDLVNAGATWVDAPALREGHLVWGRVVADIPAFCREIVAALVEASASAP